jgi:hypothetical protein
VAFEKPRAILNVSAKDILCHGGQYSCIINNIPQSTFS